LRIIGDYHYCSTVRCHFLNPAEWAARLDPLSLMRQTDLQLSYYGSIIPMCQEEILP